MTKTYLKYRSRITVISCLIILTWVGLSIRLFQIQVLEGLNYHTQGLRQGRAQEPLAAIRGNIYDRNNTPLTRNIVHYNLAAHPFRVRDKKALTEALQMITTRPSNYYLEKLNSNKNFVYLERNLRREEGNIDAVLTTQDPGLVIERKARRYYPHANLLGQIIGFTDVDDIGITGIEKKFDSYLKGSPGWVVKQRDGRGMINPKNNYPSKSPLDGANIKMTIDLKYQSVLHEELTLRMKETNASGATGIIMDPQTGAILALASLPDFDPNKPNQYPTEYQKIRSITDQFEPGSTFKIVIATAALDLKTVPLNQEFNCEYGSYYYKEIRINDHEEFGMLTFSQIIENSSNVGIIKIAETTGPYSLYRYARDYGFGSPTQVNLIGEIPGILRKVSAWSNISLAEVAMGHEVGVTALQMASAYAAIANGGFLMKPRLIQQIIDHEGNTIYTEHPEVTRRVAPAQVMDVLKDMLVQVVETGTGTNAKIPGWPIAGKTGTAQKFIDGSYSKSKFISNFIGFFPADNPQLLAVIILDEPAYGYHWGSIGAAPVFKRVMERIINLDDSIQIQPSIPKNIRPKKPIILAELKSARGSYPTSPVYMQTTNILHKSEKTLDLIMPEVRGMSLRKAVTTLRQAGLKSKINGSGKVVWQSPSPGTNIAPGSICQIGLK